METSSEDLSDPDVHERATSYQYHESGSANKFLGVTATTSQDIQLGLTFTVPFLSIPLNSINSLIGGNFGDIGNFLNFGNLGNLGNCSNRTRRNSSACYLPTCLPT